MTRRFFPRARTILIYVPNGVTLLNDILLEEKKKYGMDLKVALIFPNHELILLVKNIIPWIGCRFSVCMIKICMAVARV